MRKLFMLSFAFLLVIFTSVTSIAANYHIWGGPWVGTQYTDDGVSKSYFGFTLVDYEVIDFVYKDVVDHVDITIPSNPPQTYIHSTPPLRPIVIRSL